MNANELKIALLKRDKTIQDLSTIWGISRSAISQKMNGKRDTTVSQITKLIHGLKLSPDEVNSIFFSNSNQQKGGE